MLFKEVQSRKAFFPMVVIVQGMVTEVRLVQPEKAPSSIEVTLKVLTVKVDFTLSGIAILPVYLPDVLAMTAAL